MKLVVFTSALNEESTIGQLLDQIPTQIAGIDEIVKLVIDDGSKDRTREIAEQHGAIVISNGKQKRLAFSFQVAVAKALELGADIATNIDADLQFDPAEIPQLIQPILDGKADFVAADRFTDRETGKHRKPENMPVGKYLSNILGAWIVGNLSGENFRDVTCGFRAYNRKALLTLNINTKYTYTQESFQVLAMNKLNIVTMPVAVKYFVGRKSRVVNSFFGFLFGSAINILKAYRDYAPLTFFGALGAVLFVIGAVCDIFTVVHYIQEGSFSPYIFVAFMGAYFTTLAIIVWIVGLVADMMDRIRGNQEKILYYLKEVRFKDNDKQA